MTRSGLVSLLDLLEPAMSMFKISLYLYLYLGVKDSSDDEEYKGPQQKETDEEREWRENERHGSL